MVNLTVLAKYPFLKESKDYVKDNALSVKEIIDDPIYERARLIGIQRLDGAFKNRDVGNRKLVTNTDCIMELLSYPIARMISVCISDVYFTRRYALGEAIHAYKQMITETPNFLLNLSKEFNLDLRFNQEKQKFGIFFINYLHHAPTRYKEWKMINRIMNKGYISISQKELARLIQEALRERINNELDSRTCDGRIARIFYSFSKSFLN
jgi:DNA primase large subunit